MKKNFSRFVQNAKNDINVKLKKTALQNVNAFRVLKFFKQKISYTKNFYAGND